MILAPSRAASAIFSQALSIVWSRSRYTGAVWTIATLTLACPLRIFLEGFIDASPRLLPHMRGDPQAELRKGDQQGKHQRKHHDKGPAPAKNPPQADARQQGV